MGWIKRIDANDHKDIHPCIPPGSNDGTEWHWYQRGGYAKYLHESRLRGEPIPERGSLWQCDECGDIWVLRGFGAKEWCRKGYFRSKLHFPKRKQDGELSRRQLRKMARDLGIK